MQNRIRLSPSELAELKRQLAKPAVSPQTTDLQAGFLLGIQHVLAKLEEGWTIGSSS